MTAEQWYAGGQRIPYDPDPRGCCPRGGRRDPWPLPGLPARRARRASTRPGSRCCPDSRTARTAGRRSTGCSATTSVHGCTSSRSGRGTRTSRATTGTPPMERADLVEALWRHHGVRRTVVVTFDYTSLALLELLRRSVGAEPATPAAGDRGRVHDERRPVRRRAHPPVAGHADAAYPAGRVGGAPGAALAERVRLGDAGGAVVLPRTIAPARRSSPNCGRRSRAGTVRHSSMEPRGSSRTSPPCPALGSRRCRP